MLKRQDRFRASSFQSYILIGADGVYSSVRQNLYAQLKEETKLPESDGLSLPFTNVCLVGQTRPFVMSQCTDLGKNESLFMNILAKDKSYAWGTFTTEKNTIYYIWINFYWRRQARKELISKVMLEEKVFHNWSHGRAVLQGDGKLTVEEIGASFTVYKQPEAEANLLG
ncbi:hypothetical protein BKA57DRAFT_510255 [Linnemannia elongata]|nr:hypothetical protein BKA57DRAFT_510255 [Linnemannia elongata]